MFYSAWKSMNVLVFEDSGINMFCLFFWTHSALRPSCSHAHTHTTKIASHHHSHSLKLNIFIHNFLSRSLYCVCMCVPIHIFDIFECYYPSCFHEICIRCLRSLFASEVNCADERKRRRRQGWWWWWRWCACVFIVWLAANSNHSIISFQTLTVSAVGGAPLPLLLPSHFCAVHMAI